MSSLIILYFEKDEFTSDVKTPARQQIEEKFSSSIALDTMECAYRCLDIRNITKTVHCFSECLLEGNEEEFTEVTTSQNVVDPDSKMKKEILNYNQGKMFKVKFRNFHQF